ncbi:hypothetical protein BB561_003167 [Smittium simulii]|uniref:AB hydrolase-1 domain-containing protein n=1 Tax=Smittium simulii TaxID=133385 RepID=A0A2T9YML6_9FUNG|nr:hypothetical protein BB561_003167 [Smittium simulii]
MILITAHPLCFFKKAIIKNTSILKRKINTLAASAPRTVDLAYFKVESHPQISKSPIVILHGLLGSKKNWKSLSKRFSNALSRDVYSLDLRNHGQSPHASPHNYQIMLEDVAAFCHKFNLESPIIIGHSMGGKVAMALSLLYPKLVGGLVSVDMAPTVYNLDFAAPRYLKGLEKISNSNINSLKQADMILSEFESSVPKRQFVLTNLAIDSETKTLKSIIPVSILENSIPNMFEWPFSCKLTFNKPSILIGGTKSPYFTSEAKNSFLKQFPSAKIVGLPTDHWVHSERPQEFFDVVETFFKENNL